MSVHSLDFPNARTTQGARLARWMMFVDGEGMAMRGREFLRTAGIDPLPGQVYEPDVFLWYINDKRVRRVFAPLVRSPLEEYAVRWSYYTAVQGDDVKVDGVRDRLIALGFDPHVFRKVARKKSKGVDISLTLDVLGHAYKDNYDAAVLVAGDADFVPLVEEVKRIGKRVFVVFFESTGLGPELRRHADGFFNLEPDLLDWWKNAEPGKRPWTPELAEAEKVERLKRAGERPE